METGREKTDYASRFILDIFAEAFNDFLEINYGSEYHEIMNPVKNEAGAEAWPGDGSAVCLKTSFDGKSVERYLLVLYPVMRLLDDRELAELQQQMLRFRASMAGWRGRQNFGEDVKMAEKIEELAELVKLTGPEPRYKAQDWINQYRKFAEGKLEDYGELYMQSDGKTPVAHRAMGLLMRSGLLDLYKDVLKGLKQVTKEDYEIYTKKDWDGASGAAEAQALLQELHGKYEKKNPDFTDDDFKLYKKLLLQINRYNDAVKNLTFASLYEICAIQLEILSRWIGFVQDWERDMYFMLTAWAVQGKLRGISREDVAEIFEKGRVVGNLNRKLTGVNLEAFASVYCKNVQRAVKSTGHNRCGFLKVRNDICHLDLVRAKGWNVDQNGDSVVEGYINLLRVLLSYDQKRMNAVTKTFSQVLGEHNAKIRFTVEREGRLKIKEVESDSAVHLKKHEHEGKKGIEVPIHGDRFINSLKALLKHTPSPQ